MTLQQNVVLTTCTKASASLPTMQHDLLASVGTEVIPTARLCPALLCPSDNQISSTKGCAACCNMVSPLLPAVHCQSLPCKGTFLMLRLLRAADCHCQKELPLRLVCCSPAGLGRCTASFPAVTRLPTATAATAPARRPPAGRTHRAGAPAPRSPPRPAACPLR